MMGGDRDQIGLPPVKIRGVRWQGRGATELYHLQLFFLGPAGNTYFIRRQRKPLAWMYVEVLQTLSAVLHSGCLSFCERRTYALSPARLLKEQSLGPEVLRGRRKPLRNTRGARWVGTARTNGSGAAPCLSQGREGCLGRSQTRQRISIPASPRVLEKKAEGKGLEKRVSGENGKELAKLPRRAFYF